MALMSPKRSSAFTRAASGAKPRRLELLRSHGDVELELLFDVTLEMPGADADAEDASPAAAVGHAVRGAPLACSATRCRLDELLPRRETGLELPASRGGELVELRVTVVFGEAPLGLDPLLAFEAVQGGVERALANEEHGSRRLLDPVGYTVAVPRSPGQRLEDQQLQRAAHESYIDVAHCLHRAVMGRSIQSFPSPHKGSASRREPRWRLPLGPAVTK